MHISIPATKTVLNGSKDVMLPFRELETRSRTFLAVFFTFFDPWIALDEACLFQNGPQVWIHLDKSPGDTVTNCADLAGYPTASYRDFDIEAVCVVGDVKRLRHDQSC